MVKEKGIRKKFIKSQKNQHFVENKTEIIQHVLKMQ